MESVFYDLVGDDLEKIKARASRKAYQDGQRIFSAGDEADYIYFIDSGKISIFIDKFNTREEIQLLGPGDYFGEMAIFFNDKRNASAVAKGDAALLTVTKDQFLTFMEEEDEVAAKINRVLSKRNAELALKEKLIHVTGLSDKHLHVGIKGDPSLRESALTRERYESDVDKILPELVVALEDMLLRRCVYQVFISFNSGEIRVSTIMDPFSEEFHQARRLLDETYVERHFPRIDYQEKSEVIRNLYRVLGGHPFFGELPEHLQKVFGGYYENWKPLPQEEVARTLSQLPVLRSIPNYYVRNATISIIRDAIHMQFNCDGSHIVSSENYVRFLEENL
jgi:CRP-like cAMP-binding protein